MTGAGDLGVVEELVRAGRPRAAEAMTRRERRAAGALRGAGRRRAAEAMTRRERRAELLLGGAFVAVAIAIALLMDGRPMEWAPAIVLVVAFALATRVQLDVGAGYTVPTQLVFVPMLLLLP